MGQRSGQPEPLSWAAGAPLADNECGWQRWQKGSRGDAEPGYLQLLGMVPSQRPDGPIHRKTHNSGRYRHTEAMAGSEEPFSFLNLEFSEKDSSCGFPPPFFSWAEGWPGFLLHFSITLSPFLLLLSLGPHIYGNTQGSWVSKWTI